MSIDLNRFSAKELKSLITQAKKQQAALSKRLSVTAVRKKLTEMAKAEGYNLMELFAGKTAGAKTAPAKKAAKKTTKEAAKKSTAKPAKKAAKKVATARKASKKVAPKYRNPADPKETWTGRGKQPRWLAAQVKKGKKPEEFLINP